jgi:integrase
MEDAGMNFLKEALIHCCHRNSNPSSTITVKRKRNVVRKNLLPFIQNLIMHPHFFYPSSKKELTVWKKLQKKPYFHYLCLQIKNCSEAVLTKKNVAAVIKACIPYYPETCPRILAFLPALRKIRKNIQYLKAEEVRRVKETLADDEN